MFLTHPLLALIATVVTPASSWLVRRTGRIVGHYGVVQNAALASANADAVEVLGAIRTVQASTAEVGEARRFGVLMTRFLKVILVTVYAETALRLTQLGISRARDIVVLAYGMHQVLTRAPSSHGPGTLPGTLPSHAMLTRC